MKFQKKIFKQLKLNQAVLIKQEETAILNQVIMKKWLLFIIVNFVLGVCYSQNNQIRGVVKDFKTQQPIAGVSVSAGNNGATATNAEGGFVIFVPQETEELIFSHVSYAVWAEELNSKKSFLEVYLESEAYNLAELIFTVESGKDILENAYKNSLKKLEKSVILHTYFREFIESKYVDASNRMLAGNDTITTFSDGLLDYYVRNNGKSDVFVKQSRAFDNKADSLKSADDNSSIDIRKVMVDAYEIPMVKHILKSKDYIFEKDYKEDTNGKGMYAITIIPKENVKEVLYEGKVLIDEPSNLILDVYFKTSEKHHQKYAKTSRFLGFEFKNGLYESKMSYKLDESKYLPYYKALKHEVTYGIPIKGGKYYLSSYSSNNLVVTGYEANVKNKDRTKRYRESTLYNAGKNYTEEYWKTQNTLLLTKKEQDIIDKIMKN